MDNNYEPKIVDNIKHEPERHFVFIMPDDPEPEIEEIKEAIIVLRKFDKKRKNSKPKLFETYFVCNICGYVNKNSYHFKQHLKTCKTLQKCKKCGLRGKSENVKKCALCYEKFDCKNCKTNHDEQVHRKDSNWQCNKCDFKSLIRENLRKHCQSHLRRFSCETCKHDFSRQDNLKTHQQQYRHGVFATEPETKFKCKQCDRSFATKVGLREHERVFHTKIKLQCDICGKTAKTKICIQSHMQTHLKFPCPICQRMLTKFYLKRHIDQHSEDTNFNCDVCNKVYPGKIELNRHKSKCHKIDHVQCDLCGKIFKNKPSLRDHLKNHLKVSCPICSRTMTKSSLNLHMKRLHSSKEKLICCDITKCPRKFKNIKQLTAHKKIHLGHNNYKCKKCDHRVKQFRQLKVHMRIAHEYS